MDISDFSFGLATEGQFIPLEPIDPAGVKAIYGQIERPSFCLKNEFFEQRGVKPDDIVGAEVTYGDDRFTVLRVIPIDGAQKVVLDLRRP